MEKFNYLRGWDVDIQVHRNQTDAQKRENRRKKLLNTLKKKNQDKL